MMRVPVRRGRWSLRHGVAIPWRELSHRRNPPFSIHGIVRDRTIDSASFESSLVDEAVERGDYRRSEVVAGLEAALFAACEPVGPRKLLQWTSAKSVQEVEAGLKQLAEFLQRDGSSFRLVEIAGGYQLLTQPELRPWLEPFCRLKSGTSLSNPMLETLAVVAYRQPITRAEVEAVRGVQVGEILHQLLDLDLVRLAGRDPSLGRPFIYATTPKFLQTFGLRALSELPMVDVLARPDSSPTQNSPAPHLPAS